MLKMAKKTTARKATKKDWERLFKSADKDGNGTLDVDELRELFKRGGSHTPESQLQEIFKFFDGPAGDLKITRKEFMQGIEKMNQFQRKVEGLFKKFDADNSGYLDRKEMKNLILSTGHNFTPKEIEDMIDRADANKDGQISLDELRYAVSL
nr:caltractin-like [Biomphalaria glabrata]